MRSISGHKENYLRIYGVMVLLCLMLFVTVPAVAEAENTQFNDVRYPAHKWGDKIMSVFDSGPMILSRDDSFDVAMPPANDSQVTKDELAFLKGLETNARDDDTISRINFENVARNAQEFFVQEGLISAVDYKTLEFLELVNNDHRYFILERKKHFSRARPSQLDEGLVRVVENPAYAGYPSGPASQSYMIYLVLSDFDPENAELYKQLAIDVAHRREIAGVNYPSDSAAGRQLAVDVLVRLREMPILEAKYQDTKLSYIKPDFSAKVAIRTKDQKMAE
ncbi:MAG: hypothetical protein COB14_01595 [Alphaproteobacteria bacterium]|nr:MAG: hypothetical protein COB14_01595 [Alphaproteobacteria bacterium]